MAGIPRYPDDWATRIRELERQVKDLFTAANSRVRFTRLLAQMLIVGDGSNRIEIDPVSRTITFYLVGDPAVLHARGNVNTTVLEMLATHTADAEVNANTSSVVSSGGEQAGMQVTKSELFGISANIGVNFSADGNSTAANITARGDAATTVVNITSDGNIYLTGKKIQLFPTAGGGVFFTGQSAPPATGGGGYLYATPAGALRWRGPSTDTQIAPA